MTRSNISWACLLLLCFASMGDAEYMKYKDPKQPINNRIKDLIGRMTLAEKIGQMTQIERQVASADVMKKYFIGSILSGGGSVPAPQASPAIWVNMVNEFQKGALSTRLGIPMIYGIDAVHGNNNVYNSTLFPHNIGLGATRDPDLVKRIGEATALEVRATGIPYTFAPCIAVCRDPRWGRCYESYSEDHKVVQQMTDIILGLQGEIPVNHTKGVPYVAGKDKVAACAKHYVGDGGTHNGINENNTIIDEHGLLSIHMPPYYDSIIKGVATVMVSYSSLDGVKMHANHDLVTGYLKSKLHFRGFVISDWLGIDRITSPPGANYTYSVQAGINAGIDMVMVPYNYTDYIDDLTSLVEKGIISMSRIDDAVRRILRVKFTMGLFENPLADLSFADQLGKQEHRELAREAVRKSLVLLKNGNSPNQQFLPLPKKARKILVAGSHASNLGYQCGGWSIQWMGGSGDITTGTTILDAIKSTVADSTTVVYSDNPDDSFMKHNDFSFAVVVVGEPPYAETVGDSTDLAILDPGPDTIRTVCSAVKCAVVIVSGRPVVIEPYVPLMEALVAAWLPGTEGQGVADVLFGDYNFTGKLPRTWFKSVDQLPMNVGDPHYDPLYPFGFGLTINSSLPGFSGADSLRDKKQRALYIVLCSLISAVLINDLGIEVFHDVPAVVFSTGGYTGNVYHEFNDGIIPLYITARHYNKKVVFAMLEYHDWWMTKYGHIVEQLSDYPPIDFSNDRRTHCFPEAVVGLRIHDELAIDAARMPGNQSIQEFRHMLDEAYRGRIQTIMEEEKAAAAAPAPARKQHHRGSRRSRRPKAVEEEKPRFVIVSRNGSRAIENEAELVRAAAGAGFRVTVLQPRQDTELARMYRDLNASDVMVGVHGAAMTHFLFMRPGSVFIQVVPLGTGWAAETYYGEPARRLGLRYMPYKILPSESSLYGQYAKDDPVLTDPDTVNAKGWQVTKKVYLDGQNVRLDMARFRLQLREAYAHWAAQWQRHRVDSGAERRPL